MGVYHLVKQLIFFMARIYTPHDHNLAKSILILFLKENLPYLFFVISSSSLFKQDCFIPHNRLLGNVGSGMIKIQSALEYEHAFLLAGIIEIMKYQLRKVTGYSQKRQGENQSLGKNQAISHKIAEISMHLETLSYGYIIVPTLLTKVKELHFQVHIESLIQVRLFLNHA